MQLLDKYLACMYYREALFTSQFDLRHNSEKTGQHIPLYVHTVGCVADSQKEALGKLQ